MQEAFSFTADVQYDQVKHDSKSVLGHYHRRFIIVTQDWTLRIYKQKGESLSMCPV